jgi:recombination protein RecA
MAKAKDWKKSITDKYGDVLVSGINVLNKRKDYKVLSIAPMLDIALGGGIKEGSWLMLSGDPKCGKTTTAMQIAANAQKEGRHIIYLDAEGRLKEMNFEVPELDPENMTIIQPEDKPLPAEVFLISSLIAEKELDGDFSPTRAGLPKILSIFTKKMGQVLPNQRGLVILITHTISNTSGMGASKMADGGRKIQYQADTRMEVKSGGKETPAIKPWQDDTETIIGQIVNWKIICSSMGSPGGNCQSYIRYGQGIDSCQEYLQLAQQLALIERKGAWFKFLFLLEHKDLMKKLKPELDIDDEDQCLKAFQVQGQPKAYNFLKENPEVLETLAGAIKEML